MPAGVAKIVHGGGMFKILIRNLETETYNELTAVHYRRRSEAEEAVKHMFVRARPGGDCIPPQEFEVVETAEKTDSSPLRGAGSE